MPTLIKPFRGLRPAPGRAADVIAPPYDVLNSAEARERARGRPASFLHISKPEIDLPEGIDVLRPAGLRQGRREFPPHDRRRRARSRYRAALLRVPPAHGRARADGPRLRGQRRGLRREPHPQARVHAPGQGRRPRAPDHGAERRDRARCCSRTKPRATVREILASRRNRRTAIRRHGGRWHRPHPLARGRCRHHGRP